MQYTFQVIRHDGDRHDGDRFTIYRRPAPRDLVCKELPLDEARQALAEYCIVPIEQLPPIEEGGIWTAYRPVTRLRDIVQ